MFADPSCKDLTDSFALVSYIAGPLSDFLDTLRRELVPNCFLRAHVSILPPRPCTTAPEVAADQIRTAARWFHPFQVDLLAVEVFPVSDVIYISIGNGEKELRQMHALMNSGGLRFQEPFPYHPHITIAQDLKSDELDEFVQVAKQRWAEFSSPKSFQVNSTTFVQSTKRKTWVDLDECRIGPNPDVVHHAFTDGNPRTLRR